MLRTSIRTRSSLQHLKKTIFIPMHFRITSPGTIPIQTTISSTAAMGFSPLDLLSLELCSPVTSQLWFPFRNPSSPGLSFFTANVRRSYYSSRSPRTKSHLLFRTSLAGIGLARTSLVGTRLTCSRNVSVSSAGGTAK